MVIFSKNRNTFQFGIVIETRSSDRNHMPRGKLMGYAEGTHIISYQGAEKTLDPDYPGLLKLEAHRFNYLCRYTMINCIMIEIGLKSLTLYCGS